MLVLLIISCIIKKNKELFSYLWKINPVHIGSSEGIRKKYSEEKLVSLNHWNDERKLVRIKLLIIGHSRSRRKKINFSRVLFGQVCVGEISVNDSNKVGWGIGFDFYIHYNISTYIFCCYSANVEQREEEEKKMGTERELLWCSQLFSYHTFISSAVVVADLCRHLLFDEELEFSTGTKLWNVETTKNMKNSPSLGEDYGWKLTGVFIAREKFSHALSNHKIIVKCDYNTVAELQCDDVMSSRCNSLSGVVHNSEREIIFQLFYISPQLIKLRATSAHRMVRRRRKKKTQSNARGESCIVRAQKRCPI